MAAATKGSAAMADPDLGRPAAGALDHKTPLHIAANAGGDEEVQAAIQSGWSLTALDRVGNRPLHDAVLSENHEAIQALIRAGAPVGLVHPTTKRAALHVAALRGDAVSAKLLIDAGADPAARDHHGNSALHLAASAQGARPGLIRLLALSGKALTERNDQGLTALGVAILKGSPSNVAALVNEGAHPEDEQGLAGRPSAIALAASTQSMLRPLIEAMRNRSPFPPHLLARAGEALGAAAAAANIDHLALLLAEGVDVNSLGKEGRSPLHMAAASEEPGAHLAIDYLLERGANASLVNREGLTAIEWARCLAKTTKSNAIESNAQLLAAHQERIELNLAATETLKHRRPRGNAL
jgi:cytohesin